MKRVSTDMINNDMQFHLRRHEFDMGNMEEKIATQRRIKNLRDDPLAAAHAVRYQSFINRLDRFELNTDRTIESYKVSEGYVRQSVDILQRVRELAVQGGQSTVTGDSMRAMGVEVDQLLKELVMLGNVRSADGTVLFSGDKTNTLPFNAVQGHVPGAEGESIVSVNYVGTSAKNKVEIGENGYMELNQPGNEVFWAEKQEVFSAVNSSSYQAKEDAAIFIDSNRVDIRAGDNVFAIIAKINESGAAVKARIDPVTSALVVATTDAHQLMLQDEQGKSVLKDLGILKDNTSPPPHNYAQSARVSGGSMFDMVIQLRDSLFRNDVIQVGGSGIQGIDSAISSIGGRLAELGSRMERLDMTKARFQKEIPDVTSRLALEQDLDITEAITSLKMTEYAHTAALQAAGNILKPTLMDFLR